MTTRRFSSPRWPNPMKVLMMAAFALALVTWMLSSIGVMAAGSIAPATFFAAGLVFALLHLINESDRRY